MNQLSQSGRQVVVSISGTNWKHMKNKWKRMKRNKWVEAYNFNNLRRNREEPKIIPKKLWFLLPLHFSFRLDDIFFSSNNSHSTSPFDSTASFIFLKISSCVCHTKVLPIPNCRSPNLPQNPYQVLVLSRSTPLPPPPRSIIVNELCWKNYAQKHFINCPNNNTDLLL